MSAMHGRFIYFVFFRNLTLNVLRLYILSLARLKLRIFFGLVFYWVEMIVEFKTLFEPFLEFNVSRALFPIVKTFSPLEKQTDTDPNLLPVKFKDR